MPNWTSLAKKNILFLALYLCGFFTLNSQSPYHLVQAMLSGQDSLWLPMRTYTFQKAVTDQTITQTLRMFSPMAQPLVSDSGICLFKGSPTLYRFFLSKTRPDLHFTLSLRMEGDSMAAAWIQPAMPRATQPEIPSWAQQLPTPQEIWIPFENGMFSAFLFQPNQVSAQTPLVYLIAGSGPQDAFGTTGPNQPLKELAQRLQQHGIMVLVHPKVSVFLPEFLTKNAEAGLQEEYVAPADAVMAWLAHTPHHSSPVFLAGHSLGGVMAPWIAANHSRIKGVIGLAAPSTPLYLLVPQQLTFLAKKSGRWKTPVVRQQIQDMERDVQTFHRTGQLEKSPLTGVPLAYWKSVREYAVDKPKSFSTVPHLFVSGSADYQVPPSTMKAWKKWIPQATYLHVRGMDHLLRISPEPSGSDAYSKYWPVDTQMVDGLAEWILEKTTSRLPE